MKPMKMFGGNSSNDKKNADNRRYNDIQDQDDWEPIKKKKKKGKGVLIALIVIAVIIGGAVLYWKITTKPPEVDPPDISAEPDSSDPVVRPDGNRYYTILAIGEDQEQLNTDTIMLVRLDTVDLTVNVVSLPRDTVINTESSAKKVNSVYHKAEGGGIDSLMDSIEELCGFRPNNYVTVNIDAFEKIVDAIGGVWFDVPYDMDDYVHWNEITGEPFYFNVKAGYQNLDGHDALSVWRYRYGYVDGDYQRLNVQHDLMFAIAEQVLELGIGDFGKILNVISIAVNNCKTDLTAGNIQWYAEKFIGMSMENLNVLTAPSKGCMINGGAYVLLDVDPWLEMVNTYLNPYDSEVTKDMCTIVYSDNLVLQGVQYHADANQLKVTNGTKAYSNFPNYNG